jgi:predicted nucleic acid-binding OB-fold protein
MEAAKEEWIRMLTERPPDRDEDDSRYVQAVGESEFMLLELVAVEDADLTPDDRLAVEGEAFADVTIDLPHAHASCLRPAERDHRSYHRR